MGGGDDVKLELGKKLTYEMAELRKDLKIKENISNEE